MLGNPHRLPGSLARAIQRRKTPRHARSQRRRGRIHRRLLAYRDVQILHSLAPDARADSLLLVHIRRVVGHLTYEVCEQCASGVISEIHVAAPLLDSGLETRAISHLRACYPDVTWRSCPARRTTRTLVHRMHLPESRTERACSHTEALDPTGS
ncbi:hypothetical protein ABZ383_18975 [Streptomyces sp. NPDC005900]|uniref:hypothetical protein n=1 Tax=unclassified Streptomyces TaxID=2593676 RepID=UPI00340EA9CE